ncbi:MAG: YraN family protein [Planctomycetes bacterium]|nr:YraN family protein [Planctomycetota bacterium]
MNLQRPGESSGTPLGDAGEDVAAAFLQKHGYRILERNYAYPGGEIDLIAAEGDVLVFVEVKTRSSRDRVSPMLAVTRRKQKLVQRAAERFIVQLRLRRPPVRFDVVTVILGDTPDRRPDIQLFKNAF